MKILLPLLLIFICLMLACQMSTIEQETESVLPDSTTRPAFSEVPFLPIHTTTTTETGNSPVSGRTHLTKWDLWIAGPHLRGANIYQRRVYPELDGLTFMGPGPLGPPYTQEDFDHLSSMGANYVNISHPGLFGENPPFSLDEDVQANLDNLLELIAKADMFAVISFRTGPGRNEFAFFWGEEGDWFDASYYNNTVWEDIRAQDAWVAMWLYTAEYYRNNPIVVGYDLMVEPNCNEVCFDEWDPDNFYDQYHGTSYDWNQLAARIANAIRQVDHETPILVGGEAYSGLSWLPYLKPSDVPLTVYTFHQYEPFQYTHQETLNQEIFTYPGRFDIDYDGKEDQLDRAWLEDLLALVDDFKSESGASVAVNEFGVVRWAPGAVEFIRDEVDLFEMYGMNSAIWLWSASWPDQVENDAFNFLHGPDPSNHQDLLSNELIDIVRYYWNRNIFRPSQVVFE